MQPVTIFAAMDCVTQDDIIVRLYNGMLLGRPELTNAICQSRIRHWF